MSGNIVCQINNNIATVTLDNPGKLNAIDLGMWAALEETLRSLSADLSLRCVILRGAGDKAFAAGGDIEEFLTKRNTLDNAESYHGQVSAALEAIASCTHPTVAAINGVCMGGGLEIACACDLRLSAQSARFGAPINRLGFSMYPLEMEGLLRLAGPGTTLELLLEGRILDADEALARGLLTRVLSDAMLDTEVEACARRITEGAPLVARAHKQWVRRLQREESLGAEELRSSFAFLDSADYKEGISAFLGKRKPKFRGE